MAYLLRQRYLILSELGSGGMGKVYKARDTQLGNRLVAIKEMRQDLLRPEDIIPAASAFKKEANLLAGLHHPHLPSIHDHFEEASRWYLVMEFIEGETLDDYRESQGGMLPVEEVLDIGRQLCDVLHYLHTRRPDPIIFRDLKPSNIMRTPDGHLYLIDFGIARFFKGGQARDTAIAYSRGYAAPEQYGVAQTTVRSDIYSLGATLHHLLSGIHPALTPFQFAPLENRQESVLRLNRLISSMVEIKENNRPTSIAAVRQELERIRAMESQSQTTPIRSRRRTDTQPARPFSANSFPLTQSMDFSSDQSSAIVSSSSQLQRDHRKIHRENPLISAFKVLGIIFQLLFTDGLLCTGTTAPFFVFGRIDIGLPVLGGMILCLIVGHLLAHFINGWPLYRGAYVWREDIDGCFSIAINYIVMLGVFIVLCGAVGIVESDIALYWPKEITDSRLGIAVLIEIISGLLYTISSAVMGLYYEYYN